MKAAGIILAGGLSRRMGGQEKSLLSLDGKTPVKWVAQGLRRQVDAIALNANGDPARFAFLDMPVIADTVEGFVGPLAGVLAGMHWASRLQGVTHVVTAAADTPFLPANLVSRLMQSVVEKDGVAMAQSVGRVHPVFGLWPIHLAGPLERFLVDEDKRKILEFANRWPLTEVNFDDVGSDPFFNINTPEDLATARDMIGNTIR